MAKRTLIDGVVNRVALVGLELEGGWDAPVDGHKIIHDGSVKFEDPYTDIITDPVSGRKTLVARADPKPFPRHNVGEIVSGKLPVEEVEGWLRKCYPQHVNETCGLHVHMSFHHKLNYSRLIVPEFTNHVVNELRHFGKREGVPEGSMFWNRLNPEHPWTRHHCMHRFLGDKQVLMKKKDYNSRGTDYSRYTFINYPYGQNLPTVECRGLPMFGAAGRLTATEDVELAIKAVMAVITATNRFLSKVRLREKKINVSVPIRPTITYEIGSIVR